jgi:hypothetical protein
MKAESIARQATPPAQIANGSTVGIYTRMGNLVTEGQAHYPTAAGLCIGEDFYAARLYRFVVTDYPDLPAQAPANEKILTDAPVVEAKVGNNAAAKKGQAHPDNLPDDVQRAVVTTTDLTEPQINRVLSAVGDAALRILKDIGVGEGEVYGRVHKVQAAVREALKPSAKDLQKALDKEDKEDE